MGYKTHVQVRISPMKGTVVSALHRARKPKETDSPLGEFDRFKRGGSEVIGAEASFTRSRDLRARMSVVLVAAALWLPTARAAAVNLSLDGTEIELPSPEGFVELTKEQAKAYEYQRQFVSSVNKQFAIFIAESEFPIALRGEIPTFGRSFRVQTPKELVPVSATASQFADLKHVVKTQNAELFAQVREEMPGLFERVGRAASEHLDWDLELAPGSVVPLEPHEESERVLSSSMFMSFEVMGNNSVPVVVVATTTLVHVKGRVLFLYCYGEDSALEWTRRASQSWTKEILELNQFTGTAAAGEQLAEVIDAVDWSRVLEKGVVGAVLAGLAIAFSWLWRRRRAS